MPPDPRNDAIRADLVHRSIAGLAGHVVLLAACVGTSSFLHAHPSLCVLATAGMLAVVAARLIVARAYARKASTAVYTVFRIGTLVSAVIWGVGGASLIVATSFSRDSWLVLLTIAGVSAAGMASLAGDLPLLKAHTLTALVPVLVAAAVMPGPRHVALGFAVVVIAFIAFLIVQGGYANETLRALENARATSVQASRIKSDFLANMSHEIRTPMTAVIGYSDLLLDPQLSASDRVDYVQTIRRNGEHLLALINDILDLSKIEAGKMSLETVEASPAQVIVDVASSMRVRAGEKGLTFGVEYEGPIPRVIHTDPTRLRQVVMNFVGNAIKFTEKGGVRIAMRCDARHEKLVIDVSDTGIGITRAQLNRLFVSFVQADASTTRRFGGSGLGLVISRKLAHLLGGNVIVLSKAGRGSTFRLTIPTGSLAGVEMVTELAEAGRTDMPSAQAPSEQPLRGRRVLLAEDGYDNQLLISTYLRRAGADVTVAADGMAAVERARAQRYDVVLMDMQMPELDGYGATSKLRQLGYAGPIIALTAHAMAGDRERCEKSGCDDYLSKPVDRTKLVAVVETWAARSGVAESAAGGAAQAPHVALAPLTSTLADDAEIADLVQDFARALPARSKEIADAASSGDFPALARLAHQLKGSAGSYGYDVITDAARAVEDAARGSDERVALSDAVATLGTLCRRAHAGVEGSAS
ncbi:MAG TPA: ATP-binding protein [Polyangiaceae bacterium]|jgi:signal transduction histidine kinase/DNA-binding NarL/FixJ family response regulator